MEFGEGDELGEVSVDGIESMEFCICRSLNLTFQGVKKTVTVFSFLSWPKNTVPEGDELQALLTVVKRLSVPNDTVANPPIIHDRAGVGRAGVFIALIHLLHELASGSVEEATDDKDLIFETVNTLREQRMMMVQSELQYEFLYKVLEEELRKKQAADEKLKVVSAADGHSRLIERIDQVFGIYERGFKSLCEHFISEPPEDVSDRMFEYHKLRLGTWTEIIMNFNSINTEGDVVATARKYARKEDVLLMLSRLRLAARTILTHI